MKILIASWDLKHVGGITNYLSLLIKNISDEYSVYFFTLGLSPPYHKKIILPIIYFFQFLKLIIKIKDINPDLVHLNPSLNPYMIIRDFILLNISKSYGFPVIFFVRGWNWNFFERIKKKYYLRKIFIKNINKADKILVLSKDFRQSLVDLGLNKDKIIVTSTMVDSKLYLPKNSEDDNTYLILFCAKMIKLKGVYEFINAIPKVLKHKKNVKFIFMGDGPELKNLKSLSEKMHIKSNVKFTSNKIGREKINIFRKSHLFVFPSYREGFPNVVLEAMAAGLPIIATPVGGLKYALKDGENGLIIQSMPPDSNEIAMKIVQLLDDSELMKKMSENNIIESREKYDVKIICSQIENIYSKHLK